MNHFVLQGGSPDDDLGIRTPMDSDLNSDVKDAKGRPGRDLVTTQRNSCDQRDYLRVTFFFGVRNKNPIGKWARYGVILFLFLGRPLVFGRLFVSGVSGWPKCFFFGRGNQMGEVV